MGIPNIGEQTTFGRKKTIRLHHRPAGHEVIRFGEQIAGKNFGRHSRRLCKSTAATDARQQNYEENGPPDMHAVRAGGGLNPAVPAPGTCARVGANLFQAVGNNDAGEKFRVFESELAGHSEANRSAMVSR